MIWGTPIFGNTQVESWIIMFDVDIVAILFVTSMCAIGSINSHDISIGDGKLNPNP